MRAVSHRTLLKGYAQYQRLALHIVALQDWMRRATSVCHMQIELNGNVSSQFLTAILMAAPLAEGEGYTEIICKDLISQPYVEMTVDLMAHFNVEVGRPFWHIPSFIFHHRGCSLAHDISTLSMPA